MLPLLKKKRVLLLDDDPSIQRLIATILRREGYRVDIVSTGRQAIEKIDKVPYDALLLDVMTPTEGGATVVNHLRETKSPALSRAILVSAAPLPVLRKISGKVAVLRKPFEPAALIDAVEKIAKG